MINEKPTEKQIELLLRIAPGPLGCGMKIYEAAENLGISEASANARLRCFKKNFPEAWKKFTNLRKISRKQRYNLRWKDHCLQKLWLHTFTDLSTEEGTEDFLKTMEENNKIKRII